MCYDVYFDSTRESQATESWYYGIKTKQFFLNLFDTYLTPS